MDQRRKATLSLIEALVKNAAPSLKGKQLIFLIRDYIEDADLVKAKSLIGDIPSAYLDDYFYAQAQEDGLLLEAMATIIETFGLTWAVLTVTPAQA